MEHRFQLGQVAEILDTSPQTIKGWLHRGLVVGYAEEGGEPLIEGGAATRTRRSFSINAVMQMAVLKQLIDFGMRDTERMVRASAAFAHTGGGASGWIGGTPDLRGQRLPGMPYHFNYGRTFLVIGKASSTVIHETSFAGSDGDYLLPPSETVRLVVDVSDVFDYVCGRLMTITGDNCFHPNALLDAAYPADAAEHSI